MLDIKFIIDNPELVKEGLAKKGYTPEQIDIDALIALHKDVNKLKTSTQALAEEKNRLSNSIKSASADERPAIIAKSREIGEELKKEQEQIKEQKEYRKTDQYVEDVAREKFGLVYDNEIVFKAE